MKIQPQTKYIYEPEATWIPLEKLRDWNYYPEIMYIVQKCFHTYRNRIETTSTTKAILLDSSNVYDYLNYVEITKELMFETSELNSLF